MCDRGVIFVNYMVLFCAEKKNYSEVELFFRKVEKNFVNLFCLIKGVPETLISKINFFVKKLH